MGISDGSIIATIITIHMPRNAAAAPVHVSPGISIHTVDIVQPPGIGIPLIDIDVLRYAPTRAPLSGAYSSWRRHQMPVSLRPFGARSSHWYMPHRLSTPRAYAE